MSVIVTPEFRLSYPNLFEAKLNTYNNKMEYSVTALFAKDADLTGLKKAIQGACEKKWGPKKEKWPKELRNPIRDQGERIDAAAENDKPAPAGYERGSKFLNLKSKDRPGLVGPKKDPITDAHELFAGCYGRAALSVFAYDVAGNKGVSFGLQHIQKVRDGESLSGRVRAEDAFSAIDTGDSGDAVDDIFGD